MVSSPFASILKDLEFFFNCPLEPDANDSCLIKMGIGISIQLELDRSGLLLIGCRLGVVPMSRYRDNLIREALKFNESCLPSTGVFAFSPASHQLILFTKFNPSNLTPKRIQTFLPHFIDKAKQWTDAIAKGDTPSFSSQASSLNSPMGLFSAK